MTGSARFDREAGIGFPVTGATVRKADAAQALTARGCCPFCKAAVPEGEQCKCWNKEND